jgi:hypothetical protein
VVLVSVLRVGDRRFLPLAMAGPNVGASDATDEAVLLLRGMPMLLFV